ncbi:MAG: hypothetical protein RJA36_1516 [Pseudomonadota bacterium]|jgi:HK97 gp10 family phage protein
MAEALTVAFDDAEVQAWLSELGEAANDAVRPAAQAGADVLYREVLMRVPVGTEGHWFYGTNAKYFFPAGTLRDSIYQVFSQDNSTGQKATYHVAWNHRKAPYGFMVEFGTSKARAHPFLRPAYDAKKQVSLDVAKDTFFDKLQERVRGLQ